MITIFEDKKQRLGGLTSLFIGFEYKEETARHIINIIKSCGTYFYHKSRQLWEVPLTSLSYLLDNLYYYDDITFFPIDEDNNKEVIKPTLKYKTTPFDYQLEGIEFGLNHNKYFLLDDPGLGKTLQTIYIAEELHARGELEHCLIICGIASLRDNWKKEIQKHSTLDCIIIGEKFNSVGNRVWEEIPKRVEQLKNPIKEFFIIINVEGLVEDDIVDAIKNGPNKIGLILLDEAHKCKGWQSHRGLNLLQLEAPRKIAMSGSLLMNNPLDAFIPLAWLGIEKKSEKKGASGITNFKNMYCILSLDKSKRVIGFKNLDILQQEILENAIRRKKDILNLPPKNIINEYLTMDPIQECFYQVLANSVKKDSTTKDKAIELCDKVELDTTNLLAIITRLRQATTCPQYLTSKKVESCKIDRAVSIVREVVNDGEKIVVLSSFKEPLNALMDKLKDLNPLLCTGDTPDQEISKNIDLFQTDDEHKVFLGTISKCGTGITLNRASYMIFLDQPWTYADWVQSCDRIYRIGTNKPVFIYNLICSNTIDAKISEILEEKRAISDYVIDEVNDAETLTILQHFVLDL